MKMYEMEEIRAEFPIVDSMRYWDIAYGNPVPNCVRDAMGAYLRDVQRNGVSVERARAMEVVEDVRADFARLIGAKPDEIALVKNTSEGLNIAANGIRFEKGDNVVLNELEHPNNLFCWLRLREKGVEIRIVPKKEGRVSMDDITSCIDSRTRAVAIASTTNLGFRFDLEELGEICREHSSHLVVDAVQSLGTEPLNVKQSGVTMLSASAHKGLLGPHGIGFFHCCEDTMEDLDATYVAGISYEKYDDPFKAELKKTGKKFEFGNYNYIAVHGMLPALHLLEEVGIENIYLHTKGLADKFREELRLMDATILDSPLPKERSHIVTFRVPGSFVEELKTRLEENRIRVSSHYGEMRASFALFNTEEEIEGFHGLFI
jgi:cysteine desulfurase/selenocysteine lyase